MRREGRRTRQLRHGRRRHLRRARAVGDRAIELTTGVGPCRHCPLHRHRYMRVEAVWIAVCMPAGPSSQVDTRPRTRACGAHPRCMLRANRRLSVILQPLLRLARSQLASQSHGGPAGTSGCGNRASSQPRAGSA
eukprot:121294-Chlamydomonas_euryale.AAC.4